jgi:hypothetical protein
MEIATFMWALSGGARWSLNCAYICDEKIFLFTQVTLNVNFHDLESGAQVTKPSQDMFKTRMWWGVIDLCSTDDTFSMRQCVTNS